MREAPHRQGQGGEEQGAEAQEEDEHEHSEQI